MQIKDLINKPLPTMPEEIKKALECNEITLTKYEDKNEILVSEELQKEVGYKFFPDGSALVSMTCPMPGITPEMIAWWMWWHPQADERYQVWFPRDHKKISYSRKYASYYEQDRVPKFQPNANCPTETIGDFTSTSEISFQYPQDMGFDTELLKENRFAITVCGHVSMNHLFRHTEMTHLYKQTDDGLLLISRFWLGQPLKSKFLKKKIITEKTVYGMAEHCCIEYRRLAQILPVLYEEYGKS